MHPNRSLLAFLLAIGALAATSDAHAELLYGHTYSLQNGINNWSGGFLDTRGSGCQGNDLCVSTANSTTRDGGSGTWLIVSANGKMPGAPVMIGDWVYLENVSGGFGGFLDTRGTGCQGDDFCVSTAFTDNRDAQSGTWLIEPVDSVRVHSGDTALWVGEQIHLKNGYDGGSFPGWLDVKNTGCQGNLYCVATSSNNHGANGSTNWRFVDSQTGIPSSITTSISRTTRNPGYLMKNDTASLYWDVYGNLTLTNHAAFSPTQGGKSVSTTWGLHASHPLDATYGYYATVNYTAGNGRFYIQDSTGAIVWSNWTTNPNTGVNNTLSLTECTVATTGGSPAVTTWSDSTPSCNRRTLTSPWLQGKDECWPASQLTRLLYDNDSQTELDFYQGRLLINTTGGSPIATLVSKSNAVNLCLQWDGNFTMHDASNNVVWSAYPGRTTQVQLTVDRCGMSGWTLDGAPTEYTRHEFGQFEFCQNVHRRTNGWCTNQKRTIVTSPTYGYGFFWTPRFAPSLGPTFFMDQFGGDSSSWYAWFSCNPGPNDDQTCTNAVQTCFQDDGNLVAYDSSDNAVWQTYTAGHPSAVIGYEGTNLTIEDTATAAVCNCYMEGSSNCAPHTNPPTVTYAKWDQLAKTACADPSHYMLWQNGQSTSATGYVQQLQGGGFSFVKDDARGDNTFGAEAWLFSGAGNKTSLSALQFAATAAAPASSALTADLNGTTVASDFMDAILDTGASVTVFGKTGTAFEVNGYGQYNNGASSQGLSVVIAGGTVQNPAFIQSLMQTQVDYLKTQVTVWAGPIPIYLSAGVSGQVGYTGSLSSGTSALTIGLTPEGSLDANVQIGLGTPGASVGVQGSLTLEGISFPSQFTLDWTHRNYSYSADYDVSFMSGQVDLYGTLGPITATKTLASYQGVSQSVNLFNLSHKPL